MKQPKQPPLLYFEPAEADIQKCAYLLWQEEGRPAATSGSPPPAT